MKTLSLIHILIFLVTNAFTQPFAGGLFYSYNDNEYFSNYSSTENSGLNFTAGGKFIAFFSRHIAVESGVSTTHLSYNKSYDTTYAYKSGDVYWISAKAHGWYVDVPLSFSGNFRISKKLSALVLAGVTKSMMIYSHETYLNSHLEDERTECMTADVSYAQFAAGVKYFLKENLCLRLESQFRYYEDDTREDLNKSRCILVGIEYHWPNSEKVD